MFLLIPISHMGSGSWDLTLDQSICLYVSFYTQTLKRFAMSAAAASSLPGGSGKRGEGVGKGDVGLWENDEQSCCALAAGIRMVAVCSNRPRPHLPPPLEPQKQCCQNLLGFFLLPEFVRV